MSRQRARAALAAALALLSLPPAANGQARLSLERLYSLPSLIGTAPADPAWSADGSRLAFTWNDGGYPLRDVWTLEADAPLPVRRTSLVASSPEDPGAARPVWHPDGRRLVFERAGEILLLETGVAEPRSLAAGSAPGFSPNGSHLSFLRDGDLFVLALASPEATPRALVADVRPEVYVARYLWSPDGRRLAFLEHDERAVPLRGVPDYLGAETEIVPVRRPFPGETPRAQRLGVVSLGGDRRWLDVGAPPEDPIFGFRWSPDGREILVDRSDLYVEDRRVLSLDTVQGTSTEWYRERDATNVDAAWQAEWAPDGRGIYVLSDRDGRYHVYRVTTPGGEPSRVSSGELEVSSFTVTEDAVVFVANAPRPEERHLFRVPLAGGEPTQLSAEPGTHAPLVSPDGRRAAVLFSSDRVPPELFVTSLSPSAGPEERRVTTSPLPEFQQYAWATPEYVRFESHVDGATLHGRLLVPPGLDRSRKHPAIIGSIYANTVRNQWGGRNAHPLWGLDQYLLQEGYVLLTVDVRGSWGRGKAFRDAIRLDYGGIDVEDVASGVRYLASLGFVDMDRVGVWGSSYGGLLTCMSLFKHPELFRAGVAGAPATNVFHATTGEMRVMTSPQDAPEAYERASAYTHAGGLRDPLLVIHGMRDTVVLYKDSVALVDRLIELGNNVDLVTLPDAGHGWDLEELGQTRFAFGKLVEFFERHLKEGS